MCVTLSRLLQANFAEAIQLNDLPIGTDRMLRKPIWPFLKVVSYARVRCKSKHNQEAI